MIEFIITESSEQVDTQRISSMRLNGGNVTQFLDAIASLEIPYIQVTHSLTHSLTHLLTHSQSANHLLGQGSRPFRQSKNVKKGNTVIIAITAIMAITVSPAIAAITAITDIRAITASIGIRANFSQYNYYCQ